MRQRLEQIDEIAIDVDIIRLARLDQRIQVQTRLRAGYRIAEEPVFASNAERANRILAGLMPTPGLCRHLPRSKDRNGWRPYRKLAARHNQKLPRKASNWSDSRDRPGALTGRSGIGLGTFLEFRWSAENYAAPLITASPHCMIAAVTGGIIRESA
jgi:hypothetical protein